MVCHQVPREDTGDPGAKLSQQQAETNLDYTVWMCVSKSLQKYLSCLEILIYNEKIFVIALK